METKGLVHAVIGGQKMTLRLQPSDGELHQLFPGLVLPKGSPKSNAARHGTHEPASPLVQWHGVIEVRATHSLELSPETACLLIDPSEQLVELRCEWRLHMW